MSHTSVSEGKPCGHKSQISQASVTHEPSDTYASALPVDFYIPREGMSCFEGLRKDVSRPMPRNMDTRPTDS